MDNLSLLKTYLALKKKSREIAQELEIPSFYTDYEKEMGISYEVLKKTPILLECKEYLDSVELHHAHGTTHAETVAHDAGVIVMAETEMKNLDNTLTRDLVIYTQAASILHDIKRNDVEHAYKGSLVADAFLKYRNVPLPWRRYVVKAIKNHEAFKPIEEPENEIAALISNALYDADKFRWGPENFTKTLWIMVVNDRLPIKTFYENFLKGLEFIDKIQYTFRTRTGMQYGPEFIKKGLYIGRWLYNELAQIVEDGNYNRL